MADYTPTTEEMHEAVAEWMWSRRMFRADLTASDGKEFDRWLERHDAEKRAEWEAEQDTEEPEWETERVEQARIHYRYGVNSGTLMARNTPESVAVAIEQHEHRTQGPIGVGKIETRTKVTRTSPWMPVEQGDE